MKRLIGVSLKERFEDKCELVTESGCWLWLAYVDRNGYGQIQVDKKTRYAHQVSYELYVGPITEWMHVLHKCDNPCCVNPYHLFLGTHSDNIADIMKKGRSPKGVKNGHAKLVESQIIKIRQQYETGNYSQRDLARKYNTAQHNISRIASGKRWAHVGQ